MLDGKRGGLDNLEFRDDLGFWDTPKCALNTLNIEAVALSVRISKVLCGVARWK